MYISHNQVLGKAAGVQTPQVLHLQLRLLKLLLRHGLLPGTFRILQVHRPVSMQWSGLWPLPLPVLLPKRALQLMDQEMLLHLQKHFRI